MKFSTTLALAPSLFGAILVSSSPLAASFFPNPKVDLRLLKKRAPTLTDTQILQFALTLEHLESAFYMQAMNQYSASDFVSAGFPEWTYGRLAQIAEHESSHVAYLTSALANDTVKECNYTFPYSDVKSFFALSQVLESVGTSAYLGAAPSISDKSTLGNAGSILTTEARHAAWVAGAVSKGNPWTGAYDTPLTPTQAYTLASAFITSCPPENPPSPLTPFPSLTISEAQPSENATLTFNSTSSGPFYLIVYAGHLVHHANITVQSTTSDNSNSTANSTTPDSGTGSGSGLNVVTIPPGLMGLSYAIVTTDRNSPSDDNTVAGPAILNYPFNSTVRNLE